MKIGYWYSYNLTRPKSFPKVRNVILTFHESTPGVNAEATETITSYDPWRGVSVPSAIRFPNTLGGRPPVLRTRTSFMPEGSSETLIVMSTAVEPAVSSTRTHFLQLDIAANKEKYLETESRVSEDRVNRADASLASLETTKQVYEELRVPSYRLAFSTDIEQTLKDLTNSFHDLSQSIGWIEEKPLATEVRVAYLEAENEYLWQALKSGGV